MNTGKNGEKHGLEREEAEAIKRRIRARFSHLSGQVSLAEELIAERGKQAGRKDRQ